MSHKVRLESSFSAFSSMQGIPTALIDRKLVLNALSLVAEVGRHGRSFLADRSGLTTVYHVVIKWNFGVF